MAATTTISFDLSEHVAEGLPADPAEREQIVALGLKEWRIRKALEQFRRGAGTLAHAAATARVPLREMIPLAFAHGLTPRVDERSLDEPLSADVASRL